MRINLLGQRGPVGGGRHFGEFVDALLSLHLVNQGISEYDYFNEAHHRECMNTIGSDDINIHFVNVNALPDKFLPRKWPQLPGKNIHWAIFESTRLDQKLVDWLGTADLVFVPSSWGKSVLIDHGIVADKIEVVPEGVDPAKFHPLLRHSYTSHHDKIYRVLVVGKFEERKGFPELLEGFAKAFGNHESVKLLLKSDSLWLKQIGNDAYEQNLADLRSEVANAGIANVSFVNGELTDSDLVHLYNACDLLLFPSRAEGWGLPLIEAVAAGLPVATTFYSGHTEFLAPVKDKVGILQHSMVPMGQNGINGEWACADADTIAAQLVAMRENQAKYEASALEASTYIRRHFSWQAAAETCIDLLRRRYELFQVSLDI